MYRVCFSPPIARRYPVILRDTTGGGVSYFCSTIVFNPLALRALPLYSLTETQGERRGNSITSIVGLFNPSPRRYTPQLSLIFSCATHRNASGHGRGGVKYLSSSLFYCCFNPSVTSCHLPYILRCKTQGRRVRVTLRSLQCDTPHTGYGKGGL